MFWSLSLIPQFYRSKAYWWVDYHRRAQYKPCTLGALDCDSWMRCGPDGWVDKAGATSATAGLHILPGDRTLAGCSRRGRASLGRRRSRRWLEAQRVSSWVPTLAATLPSSPRPSCEPSDNKVLVPWLCDTRAGDVHAAAWAT
jgi:hypothetical protein